MKLVAETSGGCDSQVPKEMQAVVGALRSLWQECLKALVGRKREIDDNSKRIGTLFWHLNAGDVSPGVQARLLQLATALSSGDLNTAMSIEVLSGVMPSCHSLGCLPVLCLH
jgi:protein transport protein SEC31